MKFYKQKTEKKAISLNEKKLLSDTNKKVDNRAKNRDIILIG